MEEVKLALLSQVQKTSIISRWIRGQTRSLSSNLTKVQLLSTKTKRRTITSLNRAAWLNKIITLSSELSQRQWKRKSSHRLNQYHLRVLLLNQCCLSKNLKATILYLNLKPLTTLHQRDQQPNLKYRHSNKPKILSILPQLSSQIPKRKLSHQTKKLRSLRTKKRRPKT